MKKFYPTNSVSTEEAYFLYEILLPLVPKYKHKITTSHFLNKLSMVRNGQTLTEKSIFDTQIFNGDFLFNL